MCLEMLFLSKLADHMFLAHFFLLNIVIRSIEWVVTTVPPMSESVS